MAESTVKWVKVKGQICGCVFMLKGYPMKWSMYTCKECGTRTNLLVVPV